MKSPSALLQDPAPAASAPGRSGAFAVVVLRAAGLAALVTAVALAWWTRDWVEPVVIAGVVPRRWHAVGAAVLIGFGLLVCAALVRAVSDDRLPEAPRRPLLRRIAAGAVTTLAVLASATGLAVVSLSDAVTTFHVLAPASDSGCRVVVAENSSLLLGSGRVYMLPSGAHRPRLLASYGADDGYRPISAGTYSLRWDAGTAHLALWGTHDQPVEYEAPPLPC
ncbi:hypothetical protein ACUN7V_16305 [Quadrisphaera oryzae]|uniref:hypothetical protein n=1 Tax=Quadrisphaera TaxID=317661 RepID=UPI0016463BF2|nr:hypothetical protein [Quadrisphaera sp. RL12-1S]MBC3763586.1 hypothetical protein [Quadrisphaera sp. RL12-1S]